MTNPTTIALRNETQAEPLLIAHLRARIAHLEKRNATQEATIDRYQRDNDRLTKERDKLQGMYDNTQDYVAEIKAERDELRAQLTDAAKAEWIMRMAGND